MIEERLSFWMTPKREKLNLKILKIHLILKTAKIKKSVSDFSSRFPLVSSSVFPIEFFVLKISRRGVHCENFFPVSDKFWTPVDFCYFTTIYFIFFAIL